MKSPTTLKSPTYRIHTGHIEFLVSLALLVAIVISFAFWCNEVRQSRDFRDATGSGVTDYVAANNRRQTAFEGAVAGLVVIYAVKHILEIM